jgi:uncharacterized RDD family membrane protein YckC
VRQAKARRNTTVDANEIPINVTPRPETTEMPGVLETGGGQARTTSPIVEAALSRVMRAKQERTNLSMPAMTASAPSAVKASTTKASIIVDREATARALDPVEDTGAVELNRLAPQTSGSADIASRQTSAAAVSRRSAVSASQAPEATMEVRVAQTQYHGAAILDSLAADLADSEPIDEIDPVDYLEAEVRKVDQSLARELMSDEGASMVSQIVAAITDLFAIAISSAPFFALILVVNGTVSDKATLTGLGIVVGLLAMFYLSLTQSLCGKTFGMMFTNTRVVESSTGKRPSVGRAVLRSLIYPIAVAPAGIGILWAGIDPRRRGLQDIISGTRVVRDF